MLRKVIVICGVTLFTGAMLVVATLRVNGGFETFSDVTASSINSSVVEYAGLAREAYIYAQPLLNSYRHMYRDISDKSATDHIGAFNTLKVAARVEGETDQSITVKAWLDLRTEPMLLHVPRDGGFLNGMQMLDLYGDEAFSITSQSTDANYLIVPREWEGELPRGIRKVLRMNTDLVRVHSTTRVASAATYEHLKAWANTLALVPLSAYEVQPPPALAASLKLPVWNEDHATSTQFIPYLNFVLRFLHPDAVETDQLKRFERIGIVAGLPRAPTRYSGAISAGIVQAREELEKPVEAEKDSGELVDLDKVVADNIATIGQI